MPQTPVDPFRADIGSQSLCIKFFRIVKIEHGSVRIDVAVFQHQRTHFPHPGPSELGKADPKFRVPCRRLLIFQGMPLAQPGARLHGYPCMKDHRFIVFLAEHINGFHDLIRWPEVLKRRVQIQAIQTLLAKRFLQHVHHIGAGRIHAGKSDKHVRVILHQLPHFFISAHTASPGCRHVQRKQKHPVNPPELHHLPPHTDLNLVCFVQPHNFLAELKFPGRDFPFFYKSRMYMCVNYHVCSSLSDPVSPPRVRILLPRRPLLPRPVSDSGGYPIL